MTKGDLASNSDMYISVRFAFKEALDVSEETLFKRE